MSRKLPYGKFKWFDYERINAVNKNYESFKMYDALNKINSKKRESNPLHEFISKKLNDDEDTGYFVECDLHYPKQLHDAHNNYPLAVEQKAIKKNELSPYQLNQLEIHNERHSEKISKLVPNFYDKEKYVCPQVLH